MLQSTLSLPHAPCLCRSAAARTCHHRCCCYETMLAPNIAPATINVMIAQPVKELELSFQQPLCHSSLTGCCVGSEPLADALADGVSMPRTRSMASCCCSCHGCCMWPDRGMKQWPEILLAPAGSSHMQTLLTGIGSLSMPYSCLPPWLAHVLYPD